jgi:hypothetical protein
MQRPLHEVDPLHRHRWHCPLVLPAHGVLRLLVLRRVCRDVGCGWPVSSPRSCLRVTHCA